MSIFKNRTVIGVICILLALVICFGITPLFNQSISQKAEIVRVTKDIHAASSSLRTWSPRPRSAPTISPPAL